MGVYCLRHTDHAIVFQPIFPVGRERTDYRTGVVPIFAKGRFPVCNRCTNWGQGDVGDPNVWTAILPQSSVSGAVVRSAVDRSVKLYYAGTTAGQIAAGPGGRELATPVRGYWPSFRHRDRSRRSYYLLCLDVRRRQRPGFRVKRTANAPTSATAKATDITSNLPSGLAVKAQPSTE